MSFKRLLLKMKGKYIMKKIICAWAVKLVLIALVFSFTVSYICAIAEAPNEKEIVESVDIGYKSPSTEKIETSMKAETKDPIAMHNLNTSYSPMKVEEIRIEEVYSEPNIDPEELELLACVIYQEAGGDCCCDDCRYRVADVVLNRVSDERFPNTIYEVLTQKAQYGRFHWTGVVWPERASFESEMEAVERAYRIAEDILTGNHSELYGQDYIWQAEFVQGTDVVYCDKCGIYFGR